jgi:hypothetical protein
LNDGKPSRPEALEVGTVTSPAVTLSPNARKLVRCSVGSRVTLTEKLQEAWRLTASVAVQLTFVVPTGNCDPEEGVQATVTGNWPPELAGAAYATCAVVVVVVAARLAGQVMAGPVGMGSGRVGVSDEESPPPQPAMTSNTGKTASRNLMR